MYNMNLGAVKMVLRELRNSYNLSQVEASKIVGIPIRTYRRYEQDDNYGDPFKREKLIELLNKSFEIDEDHGLLTIEKIKVLLIPILQKHEIKMCYLFGSYAKGIAKETSDVDLLVDTDITGLQFFGLVEEIRTALHKKIDLLRLKDIQINNPISLEILKDGIRIK